MSRIFCARGPWTTRSLARVDAGRGGSGIIGSMQHDCLGNTLRAANPATLRAVDDFVEGFLAYETRAQGIVRAADADAGCCIANAYAGALWMLLEAPDAPRRAAKYLAAAEAAAADAAPRERMTAALLRAWVEDDLPAAMRQCEQITDDFPRDLVAVKLLQYFEFNRGNSPAMLRAILAVLDRNEDVAYAHGMAAFAYEQCHLLDEAEARGLAGARAQGARTLGAACARACDAYPRAHR